MSTLTIGIANRNHAHYLPQALGSALSYADEVVVVDNASTDGSQDIIREAGCDKMLLRSEDEGLLSSLNALLDMATSEYVLLLDADDYLLADPHDLCHGDWCVAPLAVCDETGEIRDLWDYWGRPATFQGAIDFCRLHPVPPLPMKAVFRVSWIRENGLRFTAWEDGSLYTEDCHTSLEWLKASPVVEYVPTPVYVYRHLLRHEAHRPAFLRALTAYLDCAGVDAG